MNKCPKIVLLALMSSFMFFNFAVPEAIDNPACEEEVSVSPVFIPLPDARWIPTLTCGAPNTGSHSTSGYYTYPAQTLDLSCYSNGQTAVLYLHAHDVPNRFTVKKDGVYVTSSGWMGCASYAGPWGMSICTVADISLPFTKNSGTYTITVETSVQYVYDYWSVN